MNIAIFNHPFYDFYTSPKRLYSNTLDYLKDVIESDYSKKNKIMTFDVVKNFKKKVELPKDVEYLKKYLKNDITNYSFFKDYYQFGNVNNFNHKILKEFDPDVIIITSFAYCYFNGLKQIIDYLKKIFDVPIICGGHGPSSNPEYYLENTLADYIVIGPAELTLTRLLNDIDGKKKVEIENVYYKGFIPLLNLNKEYKFKTFIEIKKENFVHIQLTRGCPKDCSYCSVKIISGDKYRRVGIEQFESEIKKLKLKDNVNFDFEDDNISFDKEYFINIIEIIKKYYKNSTFSFENGIDFTTLNKEIIERLINFGIKQWNISLTTINSGLLKLKGRGYLINHFEEIIALLEKFNKPIIVYFISGLIDDNIKNIFDTLLYLTSKKVIIGISPFYPVPNTKEAEKLKIKILPNLSKATSFYKWGKITTEMQIAFFILSRFINAIKNIKISEWKIFANKKIIIKGNKIISKNLSRIELTFIGILISIKRKKIVFIDDNLNLANHKLNKYIIDNFFKAFDRDFKIRNLEGNFLDREFFYGCCINEVL